MPDILAVDTEATGLGPKDRAIGVSWQITGCESRYIDLRVDGAGEFLNILDRTKGLPIAAHNASYDYRMAYNAGIRMPLERLQDTVIRATLLDEHEVSYSLDNQGEKYLGRKKEAEIWQQLADMFGGKPTRSAQAGRIWQAPKSMVEPYARPDAELCHDLWQNQHERIAKQGIEKIIEFEQMVMPTIIRSEMRGIRVDEEAAHRAVDRLTQEIDANKNRLFEQAGCVFNLDSPKQVAALYKPRQIDGVWFTRDGTPLPSTPGGEPSFGAESLRRINDALALGILETRSLTKTRDTFLRGHILSNAHDGRVYPKVHQTKGEDGGTGTGRFSYTEPALQQIPSRNLDIAAVIKPIFLPEEGQLWMDADMHSFEVRTFAHLLNNTDLLAEFRANPLLDFHQYVADLTGLPRKAHYAGQPNAKELNLSMIMGCGDGLVAMKLGLPWEWDEFKKGKEVFRYRRAGKETLEIIARYHRILPGVREFAQRARATAKKFGYLETYMGRRLRFPRGISNHKAQAVAVQATAADINKRNWVLIEQALGDEGYLMLNTHDSYGMSVVPDWESVWKRVEEAVRDGFPWCRVPLILELSGVGNNWGEAIGL
jgi:DNA polymerase I-like protein with 3'-5' exonuclease and polymerase domains